MYKVLKALYILVYTKYLKKDILYCFFTLKINNLMIEIIFLFSINGIIMFYVIYYYILRMYNNK